jgi:hypothetical protein
MQYPLFTEVALSRDLPEHNLRRRDVVRIIDSHLGPAGREAYSVEVCNALGETIAEVVVDAAALTSIESDEIFTIRRMAAPVPEKGREATGRPNSFRSRVS